MSREYIEMANGTLLVIGYDAPFETWFAMHYDDHDDNKPPRVAIGYHPAEQTILRAERPDAIIGPYPITDVAEMLHTLIPELMGLAPQPEQSMCWACGQPPWESNPSCALHPYDRLRYG
jgi:hypothetical protein